MIIQHLASSQAGATQITNLDQAAEMARLLDQDRLFMQAMGGPLGERGPEELAAVFDVLDIACGPGAWVLEVAHSYPEMEVVGIDVSRVMISYARAHAQVRGLPNAHFHAMDILKPLDIPDESFDLINISPIISRIPPVHCPGLLAECMRLLRPGGCIRITEGDWGIGNTFAFETLSGLIAQAMQRAGQSFSPTGRTIGPLQMIVYLLRKAGFEHVTSKATILDFSSGSQAHEGMYQNYRILFKLAEPFLLNMQVIKEGEFDDLYEQTLTEMLSDDFCAALTLLTAWAEKKRVNEALASINEPL